MAKDESTSAAVNPDEASEGTPDPATLQQRNDDLTDRLTRTRAELQNVLRDRTKEIDEAASRARVPLLRVLGEVLDDLDRAAEAAANDPAIRTGIELVRRRIEQAFETHQIKVENPQGEPFDPQIHEAVMREETDAHPDGTIIEVLQPGLIAENRVVRPALVKVAVGGPRPTVTHEEE